MPEQRRKFSPQFKAEAVQMVLETGKPIAEVARDLGIHEGTLGNWVNIWRRENPEPTTELTPVERARVKERDRAADVVSAAEVDLPRTTDDAELREWLLYQYEDDVTRDVIDAVLLRAGRNFGPAIILGLYEEGLLSRQDAGHLVPYVWAMAEFPLRQLDPDSWRALFAFAGYTIDGVRRARPRNPRRLYRGAARGYRDGWSWTENRAVAQWFVDRYQEVWHGRLWTVVAPPERVLAKLTGRSKNCGREPEWVVDTDGLEITPAD